MNTTEQNILKLEKRGCDFWKESNEKKVSDLENFRICGKLFSNGQRFYIEVTTHEYCGKIIPDRVKEQNINNVSSWIDNCYDKTEYYNKNGVQTPYIASYRDLSKVTTAKPTKKDLIERINQIFNTNFTDIKIVDRL